jgi:hypothetical protein
MGNSPTTVPSIFVVGTMMLVVFRIFLIDPEIILGYVQKFCSQEDIADPGDLANRAK